MNNAPQFNLGAMLGNPAPLQNTIKQIPCDMLVPYHNHKFELYTGERLEDMVESIKENGILSPIIVQPCGSDYEILIGHNRWNAAKIAGLAAVPAIIKEGLTEEEAEIYVIESNLIQRGFDNLRISEQAAVIAQRCNEMFSQGKRNDIITELRIMNGETAETNTGDTKKNVAENYGLGRTSVARLLRINVLEDKLKELIDNGTLAVRSGVELSYLSKKTQLAIAEFADNYSIDMKKSRLLRETADDNGNVSSVNIIKILDGKKVSDKPKSVKISNDIYSRYFQPTAKPREISETVEKALDYYFSNIINK